jgi:hypothetical protein
MFSTAHSVAGQQMSKANASNGGQPVTMDKAPRETPDENGPIIHKRNWGYIIHPSDTHTWETALNLIRIKTSWGESV